MRAAFRAPGHVAGGHHHSPHVRIHAAAAGQTLPLPHRQQIPLHGPDTWHHSRILAWHVPFSSVAGFGLTRYLARVTSLISVKLLVEGRPASFFTSQL